MTLQLLDQSINKENKILKMVNGGEWLTKLKLKVWSLEAWYEGTHSHSNSTEHQHHAAPSYQPEQKKGQ